MTGGRDLIEKAALDACRATIQDSAVHHAICEDYRSAVAEHLAYDRADREAERRLTCPVTVLWPEADWASDGPPPVELWCRWADLVEGRATGGGHLQAEDVPDEVLAALDPFLDSIDPAMSKFGQLHGS